MSKSINFTSSYQQKHWPDALETTLYIDKSNVTFKHMYLSITWYLQLHHCLPSLNITFSCLTITFLVDWKMTSKSEILSGESGEVSNSNKTSLLSGPTSRRGSRPFLSPEVSQDMCDSSSGRGRTTGSSRRDSLSPDSATDECERKFAFLQHLKTNEIFKISIEYASASKYESFHDIQNVNLQWQLQESNSNLS